MRHLINLDMNNDMCIFWLVFSIVFFSIGVFYTYTYLKINKNGIETIGEIIKIIKHNEESMQGAENGISSLYYLYLISYKDNKGKIHNVKTENGTNKIEYSINQSVSIIYLPKNPEKILIKKDNNFYGYMLIVLGIIFFIIAVI